MNLGCKKTTSVAAYLAGALVPASVMMAGTPAVAQESLSVLKAVTLPAGQHITSFDISFVDPVLGLYVLGDRTNKAVDVINTATNTVQMQVGKGHFVGFTGNNNTSGPDGVLIVNHQEIWVGDGDSTMKIFSASTGAPLYTISTGGQGRVDEMCFDSVDQKVMAANNADDPPFATIFDVRSHTITHQIKFDGTNGTLKATNGAEQCQWSPRTHKFIQTLPGVNDPDNGQGAISEIDPNSGAVIANVILPLSACSAPQGQAMGPTTSVGAQDLIGCNGGPNSAANGDPVVIVDDGSQHAFGTILGVVKNEVGADMVDFNAKTGHYTLARSGVFDASSPQFIGVIDSSSLAADPSVVSGKHGAGGNHSIASNSSTGLTYFPVRDNSGSTFCGAAAATGCIAVLKTTGSDSD
jgi:hypothetical protein